MHRAHKEGHLLPLKSYGVTRSELQLERGKNRIRPKLHSISQSEHKIADAYTICIDDPLFSISAPILSQLLYQFCQYCNYIKCFDKWIH